MSRTIVIRGQLVEKENGEDARVLGIRREGESESVILSEELMHITGKKAFVRYVVSDKPIPVADVTETIVQHLYGDLEIDYCMRYSEDTGYLWTDDEFKVGWRDLGGILAGDTDKYLHLEIQIEEGVVPQMYYFGCWERAGHFMYDRDGSSLRGIKEELLPWQGFEIDGKLQPHREGCDKHGYCGCGGLPEGQALLHHKNGWTALSFWDRSVDKRSACNSTFIAEGTFTFAEMVALAKQQFPGITARFTFEIVEYK